MIQKSRGDGSYSQLRRISSPLTAKKIEHADVAERAAELVQRLGLGPTHGEGVRHQDRPRGEQPEQVEVVVPAADDLGEAHAGQGP